MVVNFVGFNIGDLPSHHLVSIGISVEYLRSRHGHIGASPVDGHIHSERPRLSDFDACKEHVELYVVLLESDLHYRVGFLGVFVMDDQLLHETALVCLHARDLVRVGSRVIIRSLEDVEAASCLIAMVWLVPPKVEIEKPILELGLTHVSSLMEKLNLAAIAFFDCEGLIIVFNLDRVIAEALILGQAQQVILRISLLGLRRFRSGSCWFLLWDVGDRMRTGSGCFSFVIVILHIDV